MLELVPHEKGFALKVEELFSNITLPEYRQVMVEVIVVLHGNVIQYAIQDIGKRHNSYIFEFYSATKFACFK